MENITETIKLIENVRETVQTVFKAQEGIGLPLEKKFQEMLNFLKLKAGIETAPIHATDWKPEPITILRGQPFGPTEPAVKIPTRLEALKSNEEDEREVLRAEVNKLEAGINELSSSEVMGEFSELAIRGLASRIGMPVTPEVPERITAKFVTELKTQLDARKH